MWVQKSVIVDSAEILCDVVFRFYKLSAESWTSTRPSILPSTPVLPRTLPVPTSKRSSTTHNSKPFMMLLNR